MAAVPELVDLRRQVMEDALQRSFKDGRLALDEGEDPEGFTVLRRELGYAALCAFEFADSKGPFSGVLAARDNAIIALERNSQRFGHEGTVAGSGSPGPYFTLVPLTRALLSLKAHADPSWHGRMVERAEELFADAAARLDRTHDYLNPRALEAVSCYGLYKLTGRQEYLQRSHECLDNLVARQYPCGAQMYHTGNWVWGRRPAQVYQFLCASLMLYLGFEYMRDDVIEYVRRIAEYSLTATNRRGEAFVAVYEGLHKAKSQACAGRQWVVAAALCDSRFSGLAKTAYEVWAGGVLECMDGQRRRQALERTGPFELFEPLVEALHIGLRLAPRGVPLVPTPGWHAMPDISSVFVHERKLDLAMSLLSGYSAFAEADCGEAKLFAVTPELSDRPTYRNAGVDSLRADWHKASEQIECSAGLDRTVLSGWVYTKWENGGIKDFSRLHNRRLEVTMTYADGEMILEYRTVKNWQRKAMPSRLLFLLIARPGGGQPRLRIGKELDVKPPAAESQETFFARAGVEAVRFSAPDGSTIEIVPELSLAECITAERPPRHHASGGKEKHALVKPANEGSLRLAFEGPNVLDRGRYRIRFRPA